VTASEAGISPRLTEIPASQLSFQGGSLEVVVVNDFAHVNGGAAKVAVDSALALVQRGHSVTFLAAVPPVATELVQSAVRVVVTGQHDIKSDPSRVRAIVQGIWNNNASGKLAQILSECDPSNTIVHVHGWSKALSSSVVHEAFLLNFSVVITLHDYFYACPNGGFFNFPKNQICSLRALSAACLLENCDRDGYPQKLWRVARQVVQNEYGFGSNKVKHFICLSGLSEAILRPYLPENSKVYHVPNAVEFEKQEAVPVTNNVQFVSLGRLSPEKGLELLARAAASMKAEVTFVGEGPERANLEHIYEKACITGWQPASEVQKYLRKARALVQPSLWYEVQPVSVLEAAALGLPAIVPDTCAARELVEDGVTGLWFHGGDVVDLKKKMSALQDAGLASRLGRGAYERFWADPYTMERHVKSLENCYRSVLQCRC
jgi:glycosyltransferase involved in cell wall biosynthesis